MDKWTSKAEITLAELTFVCLKYVRQIKKKKDK